MRPSSEMRRRLVEQLRKSGYLHDDRVAEAFREVPREEFLRQELDSLGLDGVYRDEAIVTRRDPETSLPLSSSSQPAIMALMLEMLGVRPGQRIVEIGAGTGYNAALLVRLAGPGGRVVTVDVDAEVAGEAAAALRRVGARAHVVVADGTQSLPFTGAVDRIVVTASAGALPRAWYERLGPGGLLVVPLRLSDEPDRTHVVTAFAKVPGGFDSVAVVPGGFMPLRRSDGRLLAADGTAVPPGDLVRATTSEPTSSPPPPPAPTKGKAAAAPLTRGPCPGIGRDDVACLRITVRYDGPPPPARWTFPRPGHWIAADLTGGP